MNRLSRLVALFGICAAISFSTYSASEGLAARDPAAAAVTRELPWDGSESLTLEVPARVRFVQTEGPANVVVTGPRRSVEGFSARSGVLSDDRWHTGDAVEVVVHAPRITHFSLKGSDRLVVEGQVGANLNSRSIEIAEWGVFKGTAQVDTAEVSGRFEGDITVKQRLTVHATGRLIGTIRYCEIEIERGAILSGTIKVLGDETIEMPLTDTSRTTEGRSAPSAAPSRTIARQRTMPSSS